MPNELAESFRRWSFTGPDTFHLDKGVIHRSFLNPSHRRHYTWLAAGAFSQVSGLDDWYVQGGLSFYREQAEVAFFLFSDASETAAAQFPNPKRTIIRIKPDASGSVLPILSYQESVSGAGARDSLGIPCFLFEAQADEVRYVIDDSEIFLGGANTIGLLTGFRIQSLA